MFSQKKFSLILLLIILSTSALGVFLKSFSPSKSEDIKTTEIVSTNPLLSNKPSELSETPIYPGAVFLSQEKLNPHPRCLIDSIESACRYGTNSYRFRSDSSFEDIIKWYETDESNSGWKLSGGGGDAGNSRFGDLSDGRKSYSLSIGIDRTTDTEFRTITIDIPREK